MEFFIQIDQLVLKLNSSTSTLFPLKTWIDELVDVVTGTINTINQDKKNTSDDQHPAKPQWLIVNFLPQAALIALEPVDHKKNEQRKDGNFKIGSIHPERKQIGIEQ